MFGVGTRRAEPRTLRALWNPEGAPRATDEDILPAKEVFLQPFGVVFGCGVGFLLDVARQELEGWVVRDGPHAERVGSARGPVEGPQLFFEVFVGEIEGEH